MKSSQLDTLRWQFALAWRLGEYHLSRLTDDECLWKSAPTCWTVQRDCDGRWRPDWSDQEPDPPPPATIGWLSWHLIWWWSSLLAAVHGETTVLREEVAWPGSAQSVRQRLETLSNSWSQTLETLSEDGLETVLAYPWKDPRPLRIALAWANAELMKNISEIGYVRLLYAATRISAGCAR